MLFCSVFLFILFSTPINIRTYVGSFVNVNSAGRGIRIKSEIDPDKDADDPPYPWALNDVERRTLNRNSPYECRGISSDTIIGLRGETSRQLLEPGTVNWEAFVEG